MFIIIFNIYYEIKKKEEEEQKEVEEIVQSIKEKGIIVLRMPKKIRMNIITKINQKKVKIK